MKHVIVGIGEILWDVFPTGKALGGAPANFAYHATRLGAEGWAISAVGHDGLGQEILDVVKQKNLKNIISVTDKPTGTVMVTLDEKGIPSYDITRDVAWDNIPFTPEMKELAARTTAVCFGSLMQRNMTSRTILKSSFRLRWKWQTSSRSTMRRSVWWQTCTESKAATKMCADV